MPPELTIRVTKRNKLVFKQIFNYPYCRILGLNIRYNLSWESHLSSGKHAILPAIRNKISALSSLRNMLGHKAKLVLANALLIIKLTYLICIWGNMTVNMTQKAQIIPNMTARFVTGCRRRMKQSILLSKCNWLNISELMSHVWASTPPPPSSSQEPPTDLLRESPAEQSAGSPPLGKRRGIGLLQEHQQAAEVATRLEILHKMYKRLVKIEVGTGLIESEMFGMVWEKSAGPTGHASLSRAGQDDCTESECAAGGVNETGPLGEPGLGVGEGEETQTCGRTNVLEGQDTSEEVSPD